METNPFMKTSISDLVHMRNEAYKKLSLQVKKKHIQALNQPRFPNKPIK